MCTIVLAIVLAFIALLALPLILTVVLSIVVAPFTIVLGFAGFIFLAVRDAMGFGK